VGGGFCVFVGGGNGVLVGGGGGVSVGSGLGVLVGGGGWVVAVGSLGGGGGVSVESGGGGTVACAYTSTGTDTIISNTARSKIAVSCLITTLRPRAAVGYNQQTLTH